MNMLMFTTCAPFVRDKKFIQQLALDSWIHHFPYSCKMIFGKEGHDYHGGDLFYPAPCVLTASDHLPVKSNAPLLNKMWETTTNFPLVVDIFVMVNSDILFKDNKLIEVLTTMHNFYKETSFCGWARRRNCPREYWQELLCKDDYIGERIDLTTCPYHSYAGYDLFFWNKQAFEKHVKNCPPFIYNSWSTDHYINWSQQNISKWQWEITEVVDCIHLNHETKDIAHDADWEKCVQHNQKICDELKMPHKNLQKRPAMLDNKTLGVMKGL